MEGDKKIPKKRNIKWVVVLLFIVVVGYQILSVEDGSRLEKSFRPFTESLSTLANAEKNEQKKTDEVKVPSIDSEANKNRTKQKTGRDMQRPQQIVYSAKQVIEREIDTNFSAGIIPSGANFVGKLLDGIDSRNTSSLARVTIPYGVQHPKGGSIPKNSTLLGQITASGDSEKIFIRFTRIIFPSGEEYKIDAQALASSDYSPGIVGIIQSNAETRMFGSVALSMVSAAADVFTQKSVFTGGMPLGIGVSQTEPSARNAILQGVSQLAKEEAGRKAQKAQGAENYVVAYGDSDLIVSLLSPFNLERIKE